VATPQTRSFPLKEPDARNLFFPCKFFKAAAMSGATIGTNEHKIKLKVGTMIPVEEKRNLVKLLKQI
jgi:hypothetical protein